MRQGQWPQQESGLANLKALLREGRQHVDHGVLVALLIPGVDAVYELMQQPAHASMAATHAFHEPSTMQGGNLWAGKKHGGLSPSGSGRHMLCIHSVL